MTSSLADNGLFAISISQMPREDTSNEIGRHDRRQEGEYGELRYFELEKDAGSYGIE